MTMRKTSVSASFYYISISGGIANKENSVIQMIVTKVLLKYVKGLVKMQNISVKYLEFTSLNCRQH